MFINWQLIITNYGQGIMYIQLLWIIILYSNCMIIFMLIIYKSNTTLVFTSSIRLIPNPWWILTLHLATKLFKNNIHINIHAKSLLSYVLLLFILQIMMNYSIIRMSVWIVWFYFCFTVRYRTGTVSFHYFRFDFTFRSFHDARQLSHSVYPYAIAYGGFGLKRHPPNWEMHLLQNYPVKFFDSLIQP